MSELQLIRAADIPYEAPFRICPHAQADAKKAWSLDYHAYLRDPDDHDLRWAINCRSCEANNDGIYWIQITRINTCAKACHWWEHMTGKDWFLPTAWSFGQALRWLLHDKYGNMP